MDLAHLAVQLRGPCGQVFVRGVKLGLDLVPVHLRLAAELAALGNEDLPSQQSVACFRRRTYSRTVDSATATSDFCCRSRIQTRRALCRRLCGA